MARDIYPHDHVADEFYAAAVKGYDSADAAAGIEAGIAALNAAAVGKGHASYVGAGWERDRVEILRDIESSPFFQQVRTPHWPVSKLASVFRAASGAPNGRPLTAIFLTGKPTAT